jgi:DNA-binding response OmpR family regulator
VPNVRSSPGTTPQPAILLLEEYGALAVAIGSALKKFAPHHATKVARSLKEAESLASSTRPELFMIDVDPPWPKLTQLLSKLQPEHPDARVLIIGGTIPKELMADWRTFSALQFLGKPFDVAELGAAVQALLGPWKEQETERPRGTLRSFGAADAALLQCASGRSIIVEVERDDGKSGEMHFRNGQMFHVETGRRTGVEALEEIFTWSAPHMREKGKRASTPSTTIPSPWPAAFLEALERSNADQPLVPARAQRAVRPKPQARTGKKIVVVDDTEMLLIFVEDVLATADPQLQITTASDGLSAVREIERVIPDLVLLDYSLPDFNGDEVCRRLLQNEATAGVPVLMMSGHVPEMTEAASMFDNLIATIEKPFLSEALISVVREALSAEPRTGRRVPDAAPAEPAPIARERRPTIEEAAPEPEPPKPDRAARRPSAPEQQPASVATSAPPLVREPATRLGIAADVSIVSERGGRLESPTLLAPAVADGGNDVVLGLFLEVVSMQLTPSLRMGTIRAKPSSLTVSLHIASRALRAVLPATGFQLGPVELDRAGRIAALRVVPTIQPFMPMETRNSFQIGGVSVVPENSHERLELTPMASAPMRMHLLANLEIAGVELSNTFQISQIVLVTRTNQVRVTLSEQATGQEQNGATCEAAGIQLDGAARLVELVLNPVS